MRHARGAQLDWQGVACVLAAARPHGGEVALVFMGWFNVVGCFREESQAPCLGQ